jgi:hypothetical protein
LAETGLTRQKVTFKTIVYSINKKNREKGHFVINYLNGKAIPGIIYSKQLKLIHKSVQKSVTIVINFSA